jgi:bifunctional UDP-N-acetylglucosamine pyrophosphorylase/glucosamine-1-phosphate N-acetyltransferase
MIGLAVADGLPVEVVTIDDVAEIQGVNTRVHLARSERIMRVRIAERLMLDGVTLIDPETTYVEATVDVGGDTVIYPNTHLYGNTAIGARCTLGPGTMIRDSHVGDDCQIVSSAIEGAVVEKGVHIGPFAHLRPGSRLGEGVHMGNFGEVKNASLGAGTHMGHMSYIGDAQVGEKVNIGAGTVTCNYDGRRKHQTVIDDEAFVGSGTMLVAPVRIGRGAKIGAGAVVTRDIAAHTVAYGVPAREMRPLDEEEADADEG